MRDPMDVFKDLLKKYEKLQEENEKLKEFTREIIKDCCWDFDGGTDLDGGTIQNLAEKLGLIEPHIATTEEVDPEFSDYDIGDTIYKFTPILQKLGV